MTDGGRKNPLSGQFGRLIPMLKIEKSFVYAQFVGSFGNFAVSPLLPHCVILRTPRNGLPTKNLGPFPGSDAFSILYTQYSIRHTTYDVMPSARFVKHFAGVA
jgi:hypothetical protein